MSEFLCKECNNWVDYGLQHNQWLGVCFNCAKKLEEEK